MLKIGDSPTYNVTYIMDRYYDIDMRKHKATNIRDSKIKDMDLILCATVNHKDEVIYIYPELKDKVFTMKEYVGMDLNGKDLDIKDPWGYDVDVNRNCAEEISRCIEKLIKMIDKKD